MLLVELIDYNLRIRNVNGASRYLARLNLYPEDRLSPRKREDFISILSSSK